MPHKPTADPQSQAIARALGKIPSGVFVITAAHENRSAAMLASWVQQASFQPPALSLAVASGRPLLPVVGQSGQFTVSIVAKQDTALMKRFARPSPPAVDPLEGAALLRVEGGAPALADSLAWLDCRVLRLCDFGGDHQLLIGQIRAAGVLREGASFTHLRGSGSHY